MACDPDRLVHMNILMLLNQEVHPSTADFDELKAALRPYLDTAVVFGCANGLDICSELEKVGKIAIGNYSVLKEVLRRAHLMALANRIDEMENEISEERRQEVNHQPDHNSLLHNDILRCINQHLSPMGSDFKKLKFAAEAYLDKAVVYGSKSGFDICCEMEKRGHISVGNYSKLKNLLEMSQLISVRDEIVRMEEGIRK